MWFVLILLLCCAEICSARNNSLCIPSSCGNINISYPFRLQGDPPNCGHPAPVFALECRKNQTILHSDPRRYHVQEISYTNYSIRISDPGLDTNNYSSCPIYSYLLNEPYSNYMYSKYETNFEVTFLNCLSPVTNPLYVENPFCGNTSTFSNSSRVYSYVTVRRISVSDLEETCTFDSMVEASSPWPLGDDNYLYSQIHDMIAYGFQLSWFSAMCTECEGRCSLKGDKIVCTHYCDEHTPLSEQDFVCKYTYMHALLLIFFQK